MAIRDDVASANKARAALAAHCMAANIEETRTHLVVIYPPGFYPDGVRVTKANGVRWACEQARIRMERAWKAAQL